MKYDVFISYRRGKGSDLASYLNSELRNNGYLSYLDVEDVYSGDFMDKIEKVISGVDLYILLITEGSLERFKNSGDISRKELEWAIKYNKDILPISLIGDEFFKELNNDPEYPECLRAITTHNTKFYVHEMRDSTVQFILNLAKDIRYRKFNTLTDNLNVNQDILDNVSLYNLKHNNTPYLYTGTLKFGKPWGEGQLVDTITGKIYDLVWNELGNLSGKGKVYLNHGKELIYEGDIVNLLYEGYGVSYSNKGTYTGIFSQGEKVQGKETYKDGSYYEGFWKNNIPEGYGYKRFVDNTEYKGELYNSKPHGQGVMLYKNGDIKDGKWKDGQLIEGLYRKGNLLYKGDFEDELLNGKGLVYEAYGNNRLLYTGNLKQGKFDGLGKIEVTAENINNILPISEYHDTLTDKTYLLIPEESGYLEGYFKSNKLVTDEAITLYTKSGDKVFQGQYKKDIGRLIGTFFTGNGIKIYYDGIEDNYNITYNVLTKPIPTVQYRGFVEVRADVTLPDSKYPISERVYVNHTYFTDGTVYTRKGLELVELEYSDIDLTIENTIKNIICPLPLAEDNIETLTNEMESLFTF